MSPKNTDSRILTEVELEIMNAVWDSSAPPPDHEGIMIRDVHAKLSSQRKIAYTSVATIMKILEQKKILGSKKGEKAHTYFPKFSRADYESTSLKHLEKEVFRGNPSSMVMRLLDESKLSKDELQAIRTLLNERLVAQK